MNCCLNWWDWFCVSLRHCSCLLGSHHWLLGQRGGRPQEGAPCKSLTPRASTGCSWAPPPAVTLARPQAKSQRSRIRARGPSTWANPSRHKGSSFQWGGPKTLELLLPPSLGWGVGGMEQPKGTAGSRVGLLGSSWTSPHPPACPVHLLGHHQVSPDDAMPRRLGLGPQLPSCPPLS